MNNIRILLAVELRENRRLLQEYLGQYHNVVMLDSIETLDAPFDLGIFDGASLTRMSNLVRARKQGEKSSFLPFLLVTSRQDLNMVSHQLWKSIDEIIFTPIEKLELLARVEVLLRARRLSLELSGRNIELQQEVVAHRVSNEALRKSEERTKLLQNLTSELAATITLDEVSDLVANRIAKAVGGHLGSMIIVGETRYAGEAVKTEELEEHNRPQEIANPMAVSVSKVIRTGEPLWMESLANFTADFPQSHPSDLETETQSATILPLIVNSKTIGSVSFYFPYSREFNVSEQAFFESLVQQCAQAVERAQLYDELSERAALEERQRIARDLHDAVSQNLFSINMLGQSLPRLWEKHPERAHNVLKDLLTLTEASIAEMRTLLLELRPDNLVRSSLRTLFEQLISAAKARREISISSNMDFEQPLPEEIHIALYRLVQESLNNIVKHSGATEANISLTIEGELLILRIRDNGRGFDSQTQAAGLGIGVMRERAAVIGASFDVITEPGQGTEIVVSWVIA